jgi:hypothetical protein
MEIVRSALNTEMHDLIMPGLDPEAEIRLVFHPGDFRVWQNKDGKIVNFFHADPNLDTNLTRSGLSILNVDENGERSLVHQWAVERYSDTESLDGKPTTRIEYRDHTVQEGRVRERTGSDPARTYKALARLARIHLENSSHTPESSS